jgi:glycine/D-amino acid oxidase-like deaminating enzyme
MSKPTVVIVGGGVTGLSAAYHLALRNFGRIVVLDKGPVGDGSSMRAAGIITGLMWSETGVLARKIALDRFQQLSDELPGYQFQNVGCLNWFEPIAWHDREKLLALYDRCGAPYEILNSDEMHKRWPEIKTPDGYLGLYDPRGGYSEPDEYIPALANQCRRLGVEILEYTRVDSLATSRGKVRGVTTAAGSIECERVVCTNYAWMNLTLASVGVQLAVKSFVHQRYITRSLGKAVNLPAVNANPLFGYIRPAMGKRLLVGLESADRDEWKVATADFHLSSLTAAPGIRERCLAAFNSAFPSLRGAEWESHRVGLLTFSADGEPILGPIPALDGLYVGVAFHSGGFAYNPVTGMLLAELVAEGKTKLDISSFSPSRFSQDETREYLATTVPQKNASRRRH